MLQYNPSITGSLTITGSLVVTGNITTSGSITISGSVASASYADTLQGLGSASFAPAATFNIVSQSYAASSASLSMRVTNEEATSSVLTSASSSFAIMSGSLSTRVTNLEVTTSVVSSSFATTSGSISERVTIIEGQDATTGSNNFTGVQYINQASNAISFTSTASLYTDGGLRVGKSAFISGTAYFNDVVVYGTSSIEYITSSQVNIGSNIITVNTDTPAIRFGGLSVFDSGSTGLTGSLFWDSEKNHWIYSNPSGSTYNSGMIMSGPRNSGSLGSEEGTTFNALMKGQGGDHITSSQIFDDGTTVRIPGNLQVTGSLVGSSTATFASSVRTADRYLWGTATNGTTGQIVTDNTNNYFDYLGTLFIRNASASANRLILSSTGNLTIGSTEGTGSGNLYAGAATFSNNVIAAGTLAATGIFSNGDSTVTASNQFQVSGVTNTNKQLLIGYNTTGNGFGSIQAIFQGTAYTPIALNPLGGNVGIGITNPNALTEIRINTNDYGNNLMLANSYPASGVATSISFSHNTQAADPDIIARISGYIDDRTSSNRYGSLRFYTATGGTLYQRLTIASTGVPTFTVSGNDTRLANFSTTTYDSVRGLRINSYQSSNGGQDCAIEFDSGVGGYGGFKLSNSGTPMLTIAATGAATFASSVTSTQFTNTSQLAFLLNNGGVNNDFRMGSASSQFRIVNAANTLGLLTIDNAGAATFTGNVTSNGNLYGVNMVASNALSVNKGAGDSIGEGSYFALVNPANSAQYVQQLNASYGLDWWSYVGGWSKRMTLTAGGTLQVTGNISANNINTLSFTLQGLSTPVSTGLPINAYSGGRTYLLATSQQWSDGNSTSATITMIRCGYDGNNFSAVVLGSSNATVETWSQSGGILYVTGNTNFQLDIAVISNG